MRYLETDRNFYRDVVKIALPVAMQSVITTGVNLVDTIMLGSLGETALSASALANQFITLFTFLCMGVSMGASVLTSRFWGSQDLFSLKKVITVALRSGVLLALAFTAANVLFSRQIMSLYTQEQPVIDAGAEYLIWSTATFLLLGLAIGAAAGGIIFLISGPMVGFYDVEAGTKDIALQLMDALSLIVIFRSANSILTKGVLRGGGDTRFLVAADTLTMWCFAIPLGALAGLVLHLPAFWVFLLLHIDQIIKAVWCAFRLKSGKWVKTIHGVGEEPS